MAARKLLTTIALILANLVVGFLLGEYVTSQAPCPQVRGCIVIFYTPLLLTLIYSFMLCGLQKALLRTWRDRSLSNLLMTGILIISPSLLNLFFVLWMAKWGTHHVLWGAMLLWSLLVVALEIRLGRNQLATEKAKNEARSSKKISASHILKAIAWFFANLVAGFFIGIYVANQIFCDTSIHELGCLVSMLINIGLYMLISALILSGLKNALMKSWRDRSVLNAHLSIALILSPFFFIQLHDLRQMTWAIPYVISGGLLLWSLLLILLSNGLKMLWNKWQVRQSNAEKAKNDANL